MAKAPKTSKQPLSIKLFPTPKPSSGSAWTNLEKRGVVFLPGSGHRHYGEGIIRSWGYSSE